MESADTYLLFTIEEATFAVAATLVREVVRAVAITPLPGAPSIVEGVINVRGAIVPVMNARARFGLPARSLSMSDQLIVCWTGERLIALRVDASIGLQEITADRVAGAANLTAGLTQITGVARAPDGLILIHDLPSFLDQAEAEVLETALSARTSE